MDKKRHIVSLVALTIIVVAVVAIVVQREWIYDLWRGISYAPSAEMTSIRDALGLTDRGMFLFNASRPELNDREVFNEICRAEEDDWSAVLGCYTEKTIYIYDIRDDELKGIRELTTAHELLHAVWARMSEGEQKELDNELKQVQRDNQSLNEETEKYDTIDQKEELYVRAGTEVKNLPAKLEKHYAEVFKDQDRIVDYYESYIEVFRRLEKEIDDLTVEMQTIEATVNQKTDEYSKRFERLNAEIMSFNNCADIAGCFTSQWQFDTRRATLIQEQQALEEMYNEIDRLIDQYNEDVEKYNDAVIHNNRLIKIVNSNEIVEEIE